MALVDTVSWIFDKVFFFMPRIQIVRQFDGAVFLSFGEQKTKFRKYKLKHFWRLHELWQWKETSYLEPGLYWFLPFKDDIYTLNVLDQTIDLRCQSALTKDGKDVAISGAILYCVNSPHKALLNVDDVDRCLSRAALGVLVKSVKQRTFQEIVDMDFILLENELQKGVREVSKNWGLRLKQVQITDIGRALNIRFLKNEEDAILLDD